MPIRTFGGIVDIGDIGTGVGFQPNELAGIIEAECVCELIEMLPSRVTERPRSRGVLRPFVSLTSPSISMDSTLGGQAIRADGL
jgi:hypothetical protein